MSPHKQLIGIAEACGIKCPSMREQMMGRRMPSIPAFLDDLNAMAGAVKTLDGFGLECYREELAELCTPLSKCRDKERQFKYAMDATAAQRAEAFLKAIGKWKDTP